MAFRLKKDASPSHGLHHVVREQFDDALAALGPRTPDEKAVHSARKSVKRIRAVVRMLRDGYPGTANRRLRAAGHALASLRDADASPETLGRLRGRYPRVVNPRIARGVARGLGARKRRTRKAAATLAARARSALRRLRVWVPGRIRRAGDADAVLSGLVETYKRARKELRGITADSDASQFHDWRRRVKDHQYQVQLFERLHAKARRRAASLQRLAEWLGEDHNHAVLRTTILASPQRFGPAHDTAAVLGSIAKRHAHLRRRTMCLGRRLFAVKPRVFRRLASSWMP
ncbi:MAG TPA: CHAD domain-containing protein [Vicinamibacteria bacterium]|nr:CHAD domain-containing protein [Vicinamibacteria bacterium]